MDLTRPIIALCPGSVNSEAKRWPADYFARLADFLVEREQTQVVFLGAPEEKGLIDGVIAQISSSRASNLAGVADMVTSLGVMHLSNLVISNDTGSAHLAVAASATVLTIFGPTSAAATAPYGPKAYIIQGEAPCAPCRNFRCPVPGHPCMRSITPEKVLQRMDEIRQNVLSRGPG
jgi:heptosyltransferase-2